jgi:hypothetical protein
MLGDKEFTQENSGPGPNYQAESMSFGLSYADTRQIALDLWKDNALKLSQEAAQIALARIDDFLDSYFSKLHTINPELFNALKEPSMKMALFAAQRDYAKTCDEDLGRLLVQLLTERNKLQERTLLQLTLDEGLITASKLIQRQLNILTLCIIFKRSPFKIDTPEDLDPIMDTIGTLSTDLVAHSGDMWHLVYCNCLIQHVGMNFPMPKGFEAVKIISSLLPSYFTQLPTNTAPDIDAAITTSKDFIITKWPKPEIFFNIYSSCRFNTLYLTNVGTALGVSNISAFLPSLNNSNSLDLRRWIA